MEQVTPTYALPFVSMSFDDRVVKARSEASLGYMADTDSSFVTTKYGAGDLEGEIRSSSIGLFLYSLLGSVSTAGPTDEAYTHTFSINNVSNNQSLALVVEDSNTTEMYKLAMLDTFEINTELDEIVKFSSAFLSKQAISTGSSVPAISDEARFTKKMVSMKVAATIATLGAATAVSLKRLKLIVNRGSVLDDALGTAEPEDILSTTMSVEGEIELNYEDETWKNYMKDGDHKAMQIAFTNSDTKIGSGSTAYSLTLQFPRVDFFEWTPDYSTGDIVKQTISFKASRDVENAQSIIHSCVLVNDVASY